MPSHTEEERRRRRAQRGGPNPQQRQVGAPLPGRFSATTPPPSPRPRQPSPPPTEFGGVGEPPGFFREAARLTLPGIIGRGKQAIDAGDFSTPQAAGESIRGAVSAGVGPTIDAVGNVIQGVGEFGSALFGGGAPPPTTPSTGTTPTAPVATPTAPVVDVAAPETREAETVAPPQPPVSRFGPNRIIENPDFVAGRGVPGSPPGTDTGVPEGLTEVIRGTSRFLEEPGIGGASFDVTALNALGGIGNPLAERLSQAISPLTKLLAGTGFEGGPQASAEEIAAQLEGVSNAFALERTNADVGSAEAIAELESGVKLRVAQLGLKSALATSQKGRFSFAEIPDPVTGGTSISVQDTANGSFETFDAATIQRVKAGLEQQLRANNQADVIEDEEVFNDLMAKLLKGPRSELNNILPDEFKIGQGSIQGAPSSLRR